MQSVSTYCRCTCHVTCHRVLRAYPRGFGKKLLEIYDAVCDEPQAVLRQKKAVDAALSDADVFASGKVHNYDDLWPDADLWGTYQYLRKNKNLKITPEWAPALAAYEKDVASVRRLAMCL